MFLHFRKSASGVWMLKRKTKKLLDSGDIVHWKRKTILGHAINVLYFEHIQLMLILWRTDSRGH